MGTTRTLVETNHLINPANFLVHWTIRRNFSYVTVDCLVSYNIRIGKQRFCAFSRLGGADRPVDNVEYRSPFSVCVWMNAGRGSVKSASATLS